MNQPQFKFRYLSSYLITFAKRHFKTYKNYKILLPIFFAVCLLLLGFWFLQRNFFNKTHLIEGAVGTYREEDLPEIVTSLLSDRLVSLDKSGLAKPELSAGWQVSEDGKTYTFRLKDNLTWIDGEAVKASDIDLSIPDVGIEVIDDKTIQFRLADPYTPFPTLLTKPIFKKDTNHIGIGPYKISRLQKDQIFVTKAILESKNPSLPEVIIKFYPNEKIAKDALKLGEVQSLLGIGELGDLFLQKNLKLTSKTNFNQLVTIFYNTKDPVLADENLRLALSFATPSIKDEAEAKTSLAPNSWAFNPEVKDYLDNLEQAKISLKRVQNFEKLKTDKNNIITLTVTSSLAAIGQQVVDSWNKLGVKAVLRVESGVPQNFQALMIAQNIPADPDQYSLWHSTQVQTNISQFSNPRVDKNLEDARKEKDVNVRKQKYIDFQKTLMDHAPAAFLYFPKYNMIYMKKAETEFMQISSLQLPKL